MLPSVGNSTSSMSQRTAARPFRRAMAAELHRQVVDAGLLTGIREGVAAVAGVVDAVTGAEDVLDPIEREAQGATLHREILARARGVRVELAGVHTPGDGRAHELELHARQNWREDPPLPARRVVRGVVLTATQHDHACRALVAQQASDAGTEPGGDAIEHQDGGR